MTTREKRQRKDSVEPARKGPNGYRTGYTKNGDLVEFQPDEENPGKEWPRILRRNDNDIAKAHNEFYNKVWWNRHKCWIWDIESGKAKLTDAQKPLLRRAKKVARGIELKYGKKNLGWDDFELGVVNGRLSALAWVLGAEWDESLDT